MWRPTALTHLAVAVLSLQSCKKDPPPPVPPRDGSLGAQRCTGRPGPQNRLNPVLQRPFDGQYPVFRLFDHDLPSKAERRPGQVDDTELTYCGLVALGLPDGSNGYNFGLPTGTPVLAAADGEVVSAGTEDPFACPITRRSVDDQLAVELRHDGLGGVGFLTRYVHLSKVLVRQGEKVVAGQRLGLSGQSGCATRPQLSFEVQKLTATRTGSPVVVDPYGWDGPSADPWKDHEHGTSSDYLWIDGEAPTLKASTAQPTR